MRTVILERIEVIEKMHGLFALVREHQLEVREGSPRVKLGLFHTTEHSTPLSAMSPHATAWRDRLARSIKYRKIFFIAA